MDDANTFLCPYCFDVSTLDDVKYYCTKCKRSHTLGTAEDSTPSIDVPLSAICPTCGTSSPAVCPKCSHKLPEGTLTGTNSIISVVGTRGAGKSHFVGVLIHELYNRVAADLGASFTAFDKTYALWEREFGSLYSTLQTLPQTTTGEHKDPLIYEMVISEQGVNRVYTFAFFDTAGEHFNDEDQMATLNRYIYQSAGIIFLFDPLQITAVKSKVEQEVAQGSSAGVAQAPNTEVLTHVSSLIRSYRGMGRAEKIEVPVAIVFTKLDAIVELLPEGSTILDNSPRQGKETTNDLYNVNLEVQALLREWGENSFLTMLKNEYANVQFFALSALGLGNHPDAHHDGKITKPHPHRIEDPFLWLIRQPGVLDDKKAQAVRTARAKAAKAARAEAAKARRVGAKAAPTPAPGRSKWPPPKSPKVSPKVSGGTRATFLQTIRDAPGPLVWGVSLFLVLVAASMLISIVVFNDFIVILLHYGLLLGASVGIGMLTQRGALGVFIFFIYGPCVAVLILWGLHLIPPSSSDDSGVFFIAAVLLVPILLTFIGIFMVKISILKKTICSLVALCCLGTVIWLIPGFSAMVTGASSPPARTPTQPVTSAQASTSTTSDTPTRTDGVLVDNDELTVTLELGSGKFNENRVTELVLATSKKPDAYEIRCIVQNKTDKRISLSFSSSDVRATGYTAESAYQIYIENEGGDLDFLPDKISTGRLVLPGANKDDIVTSLSGTLVIKDIDYNNRIIGEYPVNLSEL